MSTSWPAGLGAYETCILGDSPVVLMNAPHSLFGPNPWSSTYQTRATPAIDDQGRYRPVPGAREMRVYTSVDTRLMLEDSFYKLEEFSRWQAQQWPSGDTSCAYCTSRADT